MKIEVQFESSPKAIMALLNALVRINICYLRTHGDVPALYKSGVRYRREEKENWQSISALLNSRFGDCEDLACWRVAELIRKGIPSRIELSWKPNYHNSVGRVRREYHVRVRVGNSLEDPSKILGM